MLKFVLGRAGYGKTFFLRKMICDTVKDENFNKKIYYIVPNQFSFECERSLLKELGPKVSRKITVASFDYLARNVFHDLGDVVGNKLDDSGRIIFMKLALKQCYVDKKNDNDCIYKKHIDNIDFVSMLIQTINTFKLNNITDIMLEEVSAKTTNDILKRKLEEISMIYGTYDALISQSSHIDPYDDLKRVKDLLDNSNYFKDSIIFMDSFYHLNGQQLQIVETIMKDCDDFYLSITADELIDSKGGVGLFSSILANANKFRYLAEKNGIEYEIYKTLEKDMRHNDNGLTFLEKNIFQYSNEKYEKDDDSVNICVASNKYEECENVCSEICRLVREKNYRYNDFAIISRSSDDYEGIIDATLDKFNIAYFMDRNEDISSKPIMVFATTLLEIADKGFNSDLIFKLLKTKLTSITLKKETDENQDSTSEIFSIDDIYKLENYCYTWDINGKKWLDEWNGSITGFKEKEKVSEEEKATIQKFNKVRLQIINPILAFNRSLKDDNNKSSIISKIMKLYSDFSLKESLAKKYSYYTHNGMNKEKEELSGLFDIFVDVFNQLDMILSDKDISLNEVITIFKIVLADKKLSALPQGADQVLVGNVSKTRLEEPKIVFLIGVNKGVFPMGVSQSGMFSQNEKSELLDNEIDFEMPFELMSIDEKFLAYNYIVAPSEKIYISYFTCDSKGTAFLPSEIITEITRIMPNLKVENVKPITDVSGINTTSQAFDVFSENVTNPTAFSNSAKKALEDCGYTSLCEHIENAGTEKNFAIKNKETATTLFGKDIKSSATRIDKYFNCPYSFFLNYGLNIQERRQAKIDALEYGTIIHYIMQEFVESYFINKNLTEIELYQFINDKLTYYVNKKLGGFEDKDNYFKYLFNQFVSTAFILCERLLEEFKQAQFIPFGTEISIGDKKNSENKISPLVLELENGSIEVDGKIDRVDVYDKDGQKYVRIIDYKTGTKTFKLSNIMDGLNLQMFLYLMTLCKNSNDIFSSKVIPAGVLYMPANIGTIDFVDDKSDVLKSTLYDNLKMKGYLVEDYPIIKAMEEKINNQYVPAKLSIKKAKSKKDETTELEFNKTSSKLIKQNLFKYIFSQIEKEVCQMGNALHCGEIAPNPIKSNYMPCKHCDYKSICNFESRNATRKEYDSTDSKILEDVQKIEETEETN